MSDTIVPFQRYYAPDPDALAKSVEQDFIALDQAQTDQDAGKQLELLGSIGAHYTMLGKEDLAAPLLEQALALAKQLGDRSQEVANLLDLATALQYLGQRDTAQELFHETLQKVKAYDQPYYEDFVLHHLGRCLVEQNQLGEARACFESALLLRQKKGDQRFIDSTQRAIHAVRELESKR